MNEYQLLLSLAASPPALGLMVRRKRGDIFAHVASNVAQRFLIKCLFIATTATELDLKRSSKGCFEVLSRPVAYFHHDYY